MANIGFAFNLTVTQGDDRVLTFIFWDEDGNPVDISTWLLRYTAKAAFADLDVAAKIQLDPADFTLSTSTGSGSVVNKAAATILSADTTAMAAADYVQDLQRIIGTTVTTLGAGTLVIEAQVTIRTS